MHDLDAIWIDDHLGRRQVAETLLHFLEARVSEREQQNLSRSYVLNIDAAWGDGKTFFLERFAKTLTHHGYPVALVNAWADDHAQDPLIAFISALDAVISKSLKNDRLKKKAWDKAKGSIVSLIALGGQSL